MSKVLLISHFFESSGWGEASRNMALAMDSVGIDVVCRNVHSNNPTAKICDRLQYLLDKDSNGCEICIQHLLPIFMAYDGNFKKCIGSFVTESNDIEFSNYPTYLDCMDELWVSSEYCENAVFDLGIDEEKIKIVPHAFDSEKYDKDYGVLDIPQVKTSYTFYYIGEAIKRKNLMALIKAFHTEFSPNEPVELVLKVSRQGLNEQQTLAFMQELCATAKQNLKLYSDISQYKQEILITSRLTEEEIYKLHNSCDCFVLTSYGEGWCIPLWEAGALGNACIYPNVGGHTEYTPDLSCRYHVNGHYVPCFGFIDSGLPELGSSREGGYEIDLYSLMRKMRNAYQTGKKKYDNSFLKTRYSYQSVGQRIKDLLCI